MNASSASADIHCTVAAGVAELLIDNVARHNAMSLGMWRRLAGHLAALAARDDVRAVLLLGAGDKAFVSGADISEFESLRSSGEGVAAYDVAVDAAQSALAAFPRPVIAAIDGICYGGGIGLALACDLRLASRRARFRMPAARMGLGYAYGGVKRMVDVLGAARAAEVFYSARVYDAEAAERIGLVGSVHDDVRAEARAQASEIAANAPLTIVAAKLAINAVLSGDPSARARADAAAAACFTSADYAEGRRAFTEKRPPQFRGG